MHIFYILLTCYLVCFLLLECKHQEGRDVCLFCSLLYLEHMEQCLTQREEELNE